MIEFGDVAPYFGAVVAGAYAGWQWKRARHYRDYLNILLWVIRQMEKHGMTIPPREKSLIEAIADEMDERS